MSKVIERQKLIRLYRDETGETEIDMRKVAEFAVRKGWPLPPPSDPIEALAKLFADAARLEIRYDASSGNPYRANHAVPKRTPAGQLSFSWIDIDDPKTTPMRWTPETGQVAKRESSLGAAAWPRVRHDQYTQEARA